MPELSLNVKMFPLLILAILPMFSTARPMYSEETASEMEREPSFLQFMVSDYLRHFNTPAAERFSSQSAMLTSTETPDINSKAQGTRLQAILSNLEQVEKGGSYRKNDDEQYSEAEGFEKTFDGAMQNDGDFGSFGSISPKYSDNANLNDFRTNSVPDQNFRTSFFPDDVDAFRTSSSRNEVPAVHDDYPYKNPSKLSTNKFASPESDFGDYFEQFRPEQNNANEGQFHSDPDDLGFGSFGNFAGSSSDSDSKGVDSGASSFGGFGSFASDNGMQSTKSASTDNGFFGGFGGGSYGSKTVVEGSGATPMQQNGFVENSKDCATIDTKTCSADDECSCHGFYHCSAGRCKLHGEPAQSAGPTPQGTYGPALPEHQLGLVG
ncbi:uncharacterized protein LOC106172554 [Lingula anatina]|uniref:Uncharacterized protein LOC106172554 n=1 Tax=Lingula anatina TaxID=7574 RepID=A0A1S3JED7_LINAN|nr:uncharacterized protein LOC106172554 [Lingula anatina]XP_013408773.1 uncharacterized protein LOC106172554 [Lingula anatina]|eukprot:XP_013408772.1 uncharacterized protein LOC106172554 [Lingula anatina]